MNNNVYKILKELALSAIDFVELLESDDILSGIVDGDYDDELQDLIHELGSNNSNSTVDLIPPDIGAIDGALGIDLFYYLNFLMLAYDKITKGDR